MSKHTVSDIHVNRFLTHGQVAELMADAEHELITRREMRSQFLVEDDWQRSFPNNPGVYAIFIGDKVMYVGETGNLRARMRDVRETRNHTFRRHHGKALFSEREDYEAATASRCFPAKFEEELTRDMGERVQISTKSVWFGRKETEEYLIDKYNPVYCRQRRR